MSGERSGAEDPPKLLALVKDIVEGLGALLAGHVRLARVELADDVALYGKRVASVAVAAVVLLLGYALACIAGALALATVIGTPLAFLAVGGAHLLGGGIALARLLRRPAEPLFGESASELDRTVSALAAAGPTKSMNGRGVERGANELA